MTQAFDTGDGLLLDRLSLAASRAAAAILAVRDPAATRRLKDDCSPVTAADEAAEAVILEALAQLMPGTAVIAEEAVARGVKTAPGDEFFLVDPLDGTREFLAGRDEYTVNIALIRAGIPVLGVIMAPARGLLWRSAATQGAERLRLAPGDPPGAARERIAIQSGVRTGTRLRVLASRSHLDAATERYIGGLPQAEIIRCGSSLKFCLLAEGSADLYPRFSPVSQWDIAAGHALLVAAGGSVTTPDGQPLRYGNAGGDFQVHDFAVHGFAVHGFVAKAAGAPVE